MSLVLVIVIEYILPPPETEIVEEQQRFNKLKNPKGAANPCGHNMDCLLIY